MNVLITGGAGYIGSHAVLAFKDKGYRPVVVDDLSTGRRSLVPADVPFVEANVGEAKRVIDVIRQHEIGAVVHFAGSISVAESVVKPLEYYENNTAVSRNLIQACVETGIERFIYSSSAAVYGTPKTLPVAEDAQTRPISPYGRSKLMSEWILQDTGTAQGIQFVVLRYFNVAGADPLGRTGQSTPEATHLLKLAACAVVGPRRQMEIFGDDYDTPDGTCIRDYIHVSDLADIHVAALQHLETGGQSGVFNCGYGRGYSVREVLSRVEQVAGVKLDLRVGPRRPGDAPALVADPCRLRETFAWRPAHDDLSAIVESQINWERALREAPIATGDGT